MLLHYTRDPINSQKYIYICSAVLIRFSYIGDGQDTHHLHFDAMYWTFRFWKESSQNSRKSCYRGTKDKEQQLKYRIINFYCLAEEKEAATEEPTLH